jgi:TRAP-type C4-dicarboxylate transport system permease small subunit
MTFRKRIDKTLELVLIVFTSVLVVDVLWQVISRYLNKFLVNKMDVHIPTQYYTFTDELAGFLLIWVSVLGAAYVAGKQEHLAIDLLLQKSKPKNQKRLISIINVFILLFSLTVMVIGGAWLVLTRFQFGVNSAALQIPLGYVYLVLPLSGLLIVYYSIGINTNNIK